MNMPILLILLVLSSCTSLVFCAKEDELSLLKIKEQLGNPDYLSSWIDGFDYCNDASSIYAHIECTSTGRVKNFSIELPFYTFSSVNASFPQAICDLTELEALSFFNTPKLGSLPSCINNLTNLRYIVIYNSDLSGSLPELGNLKKLTKLHLPMNFLSGPIPSSLSSLPNLQSLYLWNNYLSGNIPAGLVHGPDAELVLSLNRLTGVLPSCYGWQNFSSIDLSMNGLTGDASFLFGKHKTVTSINLSRNQFKFDLSNVEIPENLTYLDLSYNRIFGEVPESIATAKLATLDLSFNGLCGKLPYIWRSRDPADQWNTHWIRPWMGTIDLDGCLCGRPLDPCNDSAPASAPVLAP